MNRKLYGIIMALIVAVGTIFYVMNDRKDEKVNIGKSDITVEDGRLTPEVLWSMGRIGGVATSPDGTHVAYQTTYYSVPENASHTVIYVMTDKGENLKLLQPVEML